MIQLSMENFVQYSPMAFDMVSHILTLGFAVMLAALLYFVLTIRTVAPRYRISSVLSVVVMVSAFLILLAQAQSWQNAFTYNPSTGLYTSPYVGLTEAAVATAVPLAFTNGFRYLNWLIDVPMLLIQILFVVELTRQERNRLLIRFSFSGTMMIVTGYIGQFYEVGNRTPFLIWGAISTAFFIDVLWQMRGLLIGAAKDNRIPANAQAVFKNIWWLFLVSWMLYPGAYLAPLVLDGAATLVNPAGANTWSEIGVVARQITYTVADITSKVFYGVMLTVAAQYRSEAEGYVMEGASEVATA
ncbi:MAG: bacteriorhodopsin-like [Anaerolineae bacterium]|nr:bacteriorhodopsin-like [Anaerolineae bacterium]MDW8173464.1 bacteriorhodopsin [Anaerolineae bacterium]